MLPGTSMTRHVVFDGTNETISFLDFVRRLEGLPDRADLTSSSVSKDIEYVIPTHLYGEALRYYDNLDQDCQEDWTRLRDAMASRFPGALRSGGMVRRSTAQWEENGLPTLVDAPPLTSSKLAVPNATPEEEPVKSELRHKKSSISLSILRDKFRVTSPAPPEPHATVHTFFIGYIPDGTTSKPEHIVTKAKVDLNDPQALGSARKVPLLTITSSDADRYRAGYIFTVHHVARKIDFCHKVLNPKAQRIDYTCLMGDQMISPTGQLSEAIPLTNFMNDRVFHAGRYRAPPAKYTIQSHLLSRVPGVDIAKSQEKVGEITWRIEII